MVAEQSNAVNSCIVTFCASLNTNSRQMVDPTHNPWRPVLYARFRGQPTPLLVLPDALWTAASLWAGTRAWSKVFRESGLIQGDVIACALPPDSAFVQVLLACLWDGITVIPLAPQHRVTDGLRRQQPALEISDVSAGEARDWPIVVPDSAGQPPAGFGTFPRHDVRQSGIAVAFLSGAGEPDATTSFSAHELLAAAERHAAVAELSGACVLSVMPWHSPTELIYGLLAALLVADEIVRLPDSDTPMRDAIALAAEHPVTHVNLAAPMAVEWLRDSEGARLLMRLKGTAVSPDDPCPAEIASALSRTALRIVDRRVR